MTNRFNTRRGGDDRQRYEAERGNARSDRERYEFSDRDEGGYRGWGGGDFNDNDRRLGMEEHRGASGRSDWGERGRDRGHQDDDRDRWGMRGEMNRMGMRGDIDDQQMREGRAGYGLSSSSRNDMGHWSREGGREAGGGDRGARASSDYRGQGYGGMHGYEGRDYYGQESSHVGGGYMQGYGEGYAGSSGFGDDETFGGSQGRGGSVGWGRGEDFGHRRQYGGSMSGWGDHGPNVQGGYGQYNRVGFGGQPGFGQGGPAGRYQRGMSYGGMNAGNMQQPQGGRMAPAAYGRSGYGEGHTMPGQPGGGAWEGSWGQQGSNVGRPHSNLGGSTQWGSTGLGPIRRGKGPKGYKRSDERIREDVCDQLGQNDDIDASDIEVSVQNGEVTLTGNVSDRRMKYVAEQLAERISGVNEIHNQLRVKREHTAQAASGTQQQQTSQQTGQASSQSTVGQQSGNENGRRGGNVSR